MKHPKVVGFFTQFLFEVTEKMPKFRKDASARDAAIREAETAIVEGYSSPKRHYHTIYHAYDCAYQLSRARRFLDNPTAVEFAAWYHDIVYHPGAANNERDSAIAADRFLSDLGLPMKLRVIVHGIIGATTLTHVYEEGLTNDEKYMRDADFSILGRSWGTYCTYEKGIRKEYEKHVSPEDYRKGRLDFLENTIQKPFIFHTRFFQELFELQARRNIQRTTLEMLKKPA